jgi:hypothetical protein
MLECEFPLLYNSLADLMAGRFVDRDMFLRFCGGGIGHKAMWDALAKISKEFHNLFDENPDEADNSMAGNDNNSDDKSLSDDDEGEDSQVEDDENTDSEHNGEDKMDGADLGLEDSEETWEDVLDVEGYAPL